eukprot:14385739-Ditylum_brightwellii.AAC.1
MAWLYLELHQPLRWKLRQAVVVLSHLVQKLYLQEGMIDTIEVGGEWGDLGDDGLDGGWRLSVDRVGVKLVARVSRRLTEKHLQQMALQCC